MESKNRDSWISIVALIFTLLAALGAGFSLSKMMPHIQPWQAPLYAIVGGIFIALSDVIPYRSSRLSRTNSFQRPGQYKDSGRQHRGGAVPRSAALKVRRSVSPPSRKIDTSEEVSAIRSGSAIFSFQDPPLSVPFSWRVWLYRQPLTPY
jgi:hypothetical protein